MKKILAVSDLHCGDLISVMPKEVGEELSGRKHVHYANEIQSEMAGVWDEMCKIRHIDAVFNLGDNINGPNYYDRVLGVPLGDVVECRELVAGDLLELEALE